eukprot:TRINITY_DN1668_c0_g2_i1.p1 TRINITY_DN1668_c0_g2~~TRINITY_DN1668_c0_g2_i1.p1  ORF type:complete len:234 (+),score=29.77 TRINITY_DN1668_c0_g2_i1:46-747(+)
MASSGVKWVVAGWAYFITENLVLSENRSKIIEVLGDKGYHGVYSFCSLTSVGSISYGVMKYRVRGGSVGGARRVVGSLLAGLGAGGLAQGFPALRNVMEIGAGDAKSFCPIDLGYKKNAEGKEVYGLKRVTRHPQLWSLAALGTGAAMVSACPTVMATGLGFVPTAIFLGAHQDSRFSRGIGGTLSPEATNTTSHFPFVAIADGSQSLAQAWSECKQTNALMASIGVFLYSVL